MNDKLLYVLAYDNFLNDEYDTGIRLVDDEYIVANTLTMLHRSTTSTMFKTASELPEGIRTPYEGG